MWEIGGWITSDVPDVDIMECKVFSNESDNEETDTLNSRRWGEGVGRR